MDLSGAAWRTSSYSGGNGGQCVEVATITSSPEPLYAIRDSKNPEGPALTFSPVQWRTFTATVKAGRSGLA